MNTWFSQHRNAFRIALRRLFAAPVNTVLSLLVIGIALALPVGGLMLFSNAQQLVRGTGTLPQISLFMKLDAEKKAVTEVGMRLRQNAAVESVEFLAREATLTSMHKAEGLSEVIDALPRNPFPDAFIITPIHTDADEMEALATELRSWPQVEHVQIDSVWVRKLNAMLRLGRAGLLALSILLGAGLITITFNTIRLQIVMLKNEIDVSRLLGATDAFIGRPFFYFGTLQGVLGGLLAWLIVAGITLALRTPVGVLAQLYDLDLLLSMPDLGPTAIFLLAAGGLGWLGTLLSLSQHLRRSTIR